MSRSHPTESPRSVVKRIFVGPAGVRAGWRLLMFFLLFALLQWGLTRALSLIPALAGVLQKIIAGVFTPFGVLTLELINLTAALAAVGIMAAIEHRSFQDYGLRRSKRCGQRFWQGVAWGLGTVLVLFLALKAEGVFSFGGLALRGLSVLGYGAVWALAALLVGVFEEFVFRGYVQVTLTTATGFWPAAVISSLIFGAAHISNPGMAAMVGLSAGAFGFFFCLTVRRTGTLWFAIGMHAAFDYGETFLFSPSGGTNASAHLLNGSLRGPAWLTGGSIGPEASVNGVIVFAVLMILFARIYRGRRSGSVAEGAAVGK